MTPKHDLNHSIHCQKRCLVGRFQVTEHYILQTQNQSVTTNPKSVTDSHVTYSSHTHTLITY